MVDKSDKIYIFVNQSMNSMNAIFPIRLKQARVMRGLSMDSLCVKANNIVSKQAISKYESGKMMPDSTTLIALSNALSVGIDYFFRPITVSIDNIEFRKKARLSVKQIDSIKEIVKDKLERYYEIEAINNIASDYAFGYGSTTVHVDTDVYTIAAQIKQDWQLGEDGINNLIEILEENSIKVIEIDATDGFDGLSGYVNGSKPIIVLNANFNNERKRFTALHELGHLVLKFDATLPQKEIEDTCNLFAGEMLISKEIFIRKIGANRSDISLSELSDIQEQFGISIDTLMYKARALNIITESRYTTYIKKKSANKEFKNIVEQSRAKDEQSNRFVRLVYRALADGIISLSKASALLDCPVDKVRNDLILV
jgi:Zn-dependent peptidase ImmA (M78 family)/DNA-binding XRE family transcriptional regulator